MQVAQRIEKRNSHKHENEKLKWRQKKEKNSDMFCALHLIEGHLKKLYEKQMVGK